MSHNLRKRKYPGITGDRPDRKDTRIGEAQARQEARSKLTTKQQLQELDARLGKGQGAARERMRLESMK